MYNYLMLVGRLKEVDEENKQIKVSVQKPFRNAEGIIEQENFTLNVCDFIFDIVKDKINLNDVILIKGRVQLNQDNSISLIAEKLMLPELKA